MERGEYRNDLDPKSIASVLIGIWDGLLSQAWLDDSFDLIKTSKNFRPVLIRGLLVSKEK